MKKNFDLVFMGTPDFAVPTLKALHKSGYAIRLVVTQPDRPKGRGRKLSSPPVKEAAQQLGCDILQPSSIKTVPFLQRLTDLKPEILIVVAFGQILSQPILAIPRMGAINLHPSLLPKYRGPAPIQWAIINREKKTGVTTMFMKEELDTGDTLLSAEVEILPDDTSAILQDRLAEKGADLVLETLAAIELGNLNPQPQNHAAATYAPLLKKRDGRINWKMTAEEIDACIRGMTPWPGAFTYYGKQRLKILKAKPARLNSPELPGTVMKGFPDELRIAAGKGALTILEIQSASGRRLLINDFMRGSRIHPGGVLS